MCLTSTGPPTMRLGAGQRLIAQVLVGVDVLVPHVRLRAIGDQLHAEVCQGTGEGDEREQRRLSLWCAATIALAVVVTVLGRW